MKVYSQLERAQLENLSADPSPGVTGRIFYNTTSGEVKFDSGASIVAISTPAVPTTDSFDERHNVSIAASVAANALTLSIKNKAGSDASPASPATVGFRSSTLTSGAFVTRQVTAALSVVVSAGSDLGLPSGVEKRVHFYGIDNAGTVEAAVSATFYGELNVVSTVAEGGAGGADSLTAIYSTTARTNVAIRYLGSILITHVSGNWTTAPSVVSTGSKQEGIILSQEDLSLAGENFFHNSALDGWQRVGTLADAGVAGVTTSRYFADRIKWDVSGMDNLVVTLSRSTSILPTIAQAGFQSRYSLKVDVTTAETTQDPDDKALWVHSLEGYDWAMLKNRVVTLSFWVYSTKTGVHCVSFRNGGLDRSYVAEYTVNTTNTLEFKTITIPLNPSGGTENFDHNLGLAVSWAMVAGTDHQTTAGTWQTGNFVATANQVNSLDNAANDFVIVMPQLRLSPIVLPFKRAGGNIAGETAILQRCYSKSYLWDVAPGTVTDVGEIRFTTTLSGSERWHIKYQGSLRTAVNPVFYNPTTGTVAEWRDIDGGVNKTVTTVGGTPGTYGSVANIASATGANRMSGHFSVDADF